jgi:hypothetical protein
MGKTTKGTTRKFMVFWMEFFGKFDGDLVVHPKHPTRLINQKKFMQITLVH